ncbi:MAG: T9SS type A sorting domain-containing protein, partial [Bacteroidia bacterium]
PEKAQFFGSACGGDWVELTTTEDGVTLEQDGWIDFNGTLYGLKYLRIVDRSRRSQFNGGADGYDVDGVVSLNQTSCTDPVDIAFKVAAVEYGVADEIVLADVSPNPFTSQVRINLPAQENSTTVQVRVYSLDGRIVSSTQIASPEHISVSQVLSLDFLPSGVYMIEMQSSNGRHIQKLVKE